MIEFTPWPKIARLNRDITITEKIDGTNAAVGIVHTSLEAGIADHDSNCKVVDRGGFEVNGLHFGEWWGSGIQRGYGLPKGEKRFSLFNTKRWGDSRQWEAPYFLANGEPIDYPPGLGTVPTLYRGPFLPSLGKNRLYVPWLVALEGLRSSGSRTAPGFMRPEGIVIYHQAANMMFKVTLEGDEAPKGMPR